MKKKKTTIIFVLLTALALVILIVAAFYVNLKIFTVKKVLMEEQEVYFMGTFHADHFKRYANYSTEEMVNAIDNIDPDAVFIEARENNYIEYGVVDGPVDMCVAYCHCYENNIPVEMIDYWEITNDFKANTTTDAREDHIHENIIEKLDKYKGKRVLVLCGAGHLIAQTERLVKAGGQKQHISHTGNLFKRENGDFAYPGTLCDVWEERVLFYGHTVPQSVQKNDDLSEDVKAGWPEDINHSFYNSQMEYCKLFRSNSLYIDYLT